MSKITMSWESLCWPISLTQPPAARLLVFGTHGPNIAERHRVHGYWSIHFYQYTATLQIDRALIPIRPGYVSLIPPDTEHIYHFTEKSTHLCGHFALPSSPQAEGIVIPAMQDLKDDFARLYEAFEEAAGWFHVNPARANVRLWDILWQLTDCHLPGFPERHHVPGSLRRACELIEQNLERHWNVAALADAVGISHNQLTRQFHAYFDTTVVGYIRRRRIDRAEHLLLHTDLPIKTIALQVGIDDPRLFNKMMHQERGVSPQVLRARQKAK